MPAEHMLRAIGRFVDLGELRASLASFYSPIGRPSVDPELLIRMLERLRLRGPNRARDEFLLAATAQNLRKLAKLVTPPVVSPVT